MQENKIIIAPSMLSCDFSNLEREAITMLEAGADWLHMDVMDGHFVPNITIGAPVVKSLHKSLPGVKQDVHMMVSEPEKWVGAYAQAGAYQYTFHVEATVDPQLLIEQIKKTSMRCGIAIKPGTPVEVVEYYLDQVDMVLVMTVEPGFGGQKFMPQMLDKVKWIRERRPELDIQVDGGINLDNIEQVREAGANVVVSGSGIFKTDDYADTIRRMRNGGACVGAV